MNQKIEEKLGQVSLKIRLQIEKYKRHEDAVRKLYSELMVKKIIKETLYLVEDQINIQTNAYGKPFVEGYPKFHYNVSHSGDWIVCAVASSPVGIDVEEIGDIDLDIAKRFFSPKEVDYLFSKDLAYQKECFFELWTLKESYIKQIGVGLSMDLKDFSVIKQKDKEFVVSESQGQEKYLKQYTLDEKYKLAVCTGEKCFPKQLIYFSDA
ncbi:MAG: 4'-phosphopantetheinyl transferase family protein [Cellulosilyticaceae bacterium]